MILATGRKDFIALPPSQLRSKTAQMTHRRGINTISCGFDGARRFGLTCRALEGEPDGKPVSRRSDHSIGNLLMLPL
jgi:hypothetical protein